MKKVFNWCWDKIKKPIPQLIVIIIGLVLYWSWDIGFQHNGEIQVSEKMVMEESQNDSLEVEEDSSYYRYYDQNSNAFGLYSAPESITTPETLMDDREYKLAFWDMILGHLSSILGSVAALTVPVITWYNTNKGKEKEND